jgi:hypothetical protein
MLTIASIYFSRFQPEKPMSSPKTTYLIEKEQDRVGILVVLKPLYWI